VMSSGTADSIALCCQAGVMPENGASTHQTK
jgi:hypothetical protein